MGSLTCEEGGNLSTRSSEGRVGCEFMHPAQLTYAPSSRRTSRYHFYTPGLTPFGGLMPLWRRNLVPILPPTYPLGGGFVCWYWWNCWPSPSLFKLSFPMMKLLLCSTTVHNFLSLYKNLTFTSSSKRWLPCIWWNMTKMSIVTYNWVASVFVRGDCSFWWCWWNCWIFKKSWKPECVGSFNMDWWILVFYPEPETRDNIY